MESGFEWSASDFSVKRSRAMSDEENSDSEGPDHNMAAKLRELGSDSEDEDGPAKTKDEKTLFGSDSESGGDQEEWVGHNPA